MIDKRPLGKAGPAVGCLGYGAMVLEGYYGASSDEQAIGTIRRALDVGRTMIDSADAYGNGHNETLVGRAIKGRREDAFVATKFGIVYDEQEAGAELSTGWGFTLRINGRPGYARRALDASLQRLAWTSSISGTRITLTAGRRLYSFMLKGLPEHVSANKHKK